MFCGFFFLIQPYPSSDSRFPFDILQKFYRKSSNRNWLWNMIWVIIYWKCHRERIYDARWDTSIKGRELIIRQSKALMKPCNIVQHSDPWVIRGMEKLPKDRTLMNLSISEIKAVRRSDCWVQMHQKLSTREGDELLKLKANASTVTNAYMNTLWVGVFHSSEWSSGKKVLK